MEQVKIDKMVHGGQGLGVLADGRKVFVWNALPGETVSARIIKKKRSYVEAIAEEIIEASPERQEPSEENYLATSPWQMMTYEAENTFKHDITAELFAREHVELPDFHLIHDDRLWQYRNKMEYSFWGDDYGLHLALYRRGTHGKQIVTGSKLALPAIDIAAGAVVDMINEANSIHGTQDPVRAGDLKSIVVRASQSGEVVAALYTKLLRFPDVALPPELKGLRIYHSNPKSPASVTTKLLMELGDVSLQDELLGKPFSYDVDSFFQVNIPVFELALGRIKEHVRGTRVTDMYAGTGSIGLSVASEAVELIELDKASADMALKNAATSGIDAEVVQASTEKVLDYIGADYPVIFDPPRAGLHDDVVERVLEVKPQQVIYLSCNPATQARDLAKLQSAYDIEYFEAFNFFPRTPHIESLAVLRLK